MSEGKLRLVPTPLGNLGDLTPRAREALLTADLIAVENPADSRGLLAHIGATAPTVTYHEQGNYDFRVEKIMRALRDGQTVALISSAGTPVISDPGFVIVRTAITESIPVECLPGPAALIPALAVSGLPAHRFVFEGFLPVSGRLTRLKEIAAETRTTIIYEAPHRLPKTLKALIDVCGEERLACVCRELSKKFEEVRRGTLQELFTHFSQGTVKGEIVIVVSGVPDKPKTEKVSKYAS